MDMEFSVKDDLPIKTDSHVAILSFSPLGDNHLEIKAGSPAAARAADGAILPADQYVGFNELTEQINKVMPQAQELMANLNLRVKELSVTIARANDLLNDQNRANISASIADLQAMLREDRPLVKSALNNVNDASVKLGPMLDDLKKTSDQANETLKKLDAMLGENREDLRASIKKLRESLNNVSSITRRVDQTLDVNSETIDELIMNMRDVSENLQGIYHISDSSVRTDSLHQSPSTQTRRASMRLSDCITHLASVNSAPGLRLGKMCGALAAAALLAAGVAGCGSIKPVKYYQLSHAPTAALPASQSPVDAALLVRLFQTSHLYREDRIVYGGEGQQRLVRQSLGRAACGTSGRTRPRASRFRTFQNRHHSSQRHKHRFLPQGSPLFVPGSQYRKRCRPVELRHRARGHETWHGHLAPHL
jgi:hypothetical protein